MLEYRKLPPDAISGVVDLEAKQRFLQVGQERNEAYLSGTKIYHFSRCPSGLLSTNRFDITQSKYQGNFYFSNIPMHATNLEIYLNRNVLFYNVTDLPLHIVRYLIGNYKNLHFAARHAGFDGFTEYAKPEESKNRYREIVIFPSSIDSVNGGIKPIHPFYL